MFPSWVKQFRCVLSLQLHCVCQWYECHKVWLLHFLTGLEILWMCLYVWEHQEMFSWYFPGGLVGETAEDMSVTLCALNRYFYLAPPLSESSGCFQSLVKGRFNKIQASLFRKHLFRVCVGSTCSCPGADVVCVCPFLTLTGQCNFKASNVTVLQ